jgi:methionyl aminopeptidase
MSRSRIIINNEKDIEWIREASRIAAQTLELITPYIKVWMSTEELDNICNTLIMNSWGKSACKWYQGYPKYTCISLNDTICHWIPTNNEILKDWDIVNVDITVFKNWYFGDTSRMYTVGNVDPKALKLIEVTKKALEIWIAQVYPGNVTWNIWYEIAKYVESKWFSVVLEYTGHWIGRSMHEEPYIYHKAQKWSWDMIKVWMVFTIEPMINLWWHKTKILWDKWTVKTLDWSLSAQFEHTIAVTPNWHEILSVA